MLKATRERMFSQRLAHFVVHVHVHAQLYGKKRASLTQQHYRLMRL